MRKGLKIALVLLILVSLCYATFSLLYPGFTDRQIENMQYCALDNDCTVVKSGCGCAKLPLNKEYVDKYNEKMAERSNQIYCPAVLDMSERCYIPPTCVQNRCTIDVTDPSACEKVPNSRDCYLHLSQENQDERFCQRLNGTSQSYCLGGLAYSKNNPDLCLQAENLTNCFDYYYDRKGSMEHESAYCYKIVDKEIKRGCLVVAT
jgi:hypothetical protein